MISILLMGCGTISFFSHPPTEPAEDSHDIVSTDTNVVDSATDTNNESDSDTLPIEDSGITTDTEDSAMPLSTLWGPGEITQISHYTYNPGEHSDMPQKVFLGDVDGDGHLDLLYNSFSYDDMTNGVPWVPYTLHVRRGDGLGNFSDFDTWLSPDPSFGFPNGAVGDLNKDGYADFVLGTEAGLTVAFGCPTGFAVSTFAGSEASTLRLVDWNSDGNLDVVTQNRHNSYIVWLGNGAGTLTMAGSTTLSSNGLSDVYGYSFAVGDANSDGFPDIFTDLDTRQTTPIVLYNDGAGGFGGTFEPNTKRPGSDYIFAPRAVEVDGDANVEFLNYNVYDPTINNYAPEIWNSETDTATTELPIFWIPPFSLLYDSWGATDINHDHLPDMIRLAELFDGIQYQHYLLVSLATGTGFSAWTTTTLTYSMVAYPWTEDDSFMAVGDADEDGCNDIAVLTSDGFQLVHGQCL